MMSVGIDSHRDSLAMCVLAESGAILAEREYPNTPAGHRALGRFLARYGEKRRIGIEGSGCFGGAAADHLRGCGEEVCEVPAGRTWRERRHLGRPGKSDAGDAEAIARVVASGARLPSVGRPRTAAELKLLCDERDALCEERTRALNRLHALLRRYLPGYRAAVGTLRSGAGRARLARLLDAGDGLWVELARRHLERITSLEDECAQLAGQIEALLEASGSSLREINGIGTLTAARLLVGDRSHRALRRQGILCDGGRGGADTGQLRHHAPLPPQPRWQPAPQPRSAHHRPGAGPSRPAGPRLPGAQAQPGHEPPGGDPLPKATARQRGLSPDGP